SCSMDSRVESWSSNATFPAFASLTQDRLLLNHEKALGLHALDLMDGHGPDGERLLGRSRFLEHVDQIVPTDLRETPRAPAEPSHVECGHAGIVTAVDVQPR